MTIMATDPIKAEEANVLKQAEQIAADADEAQPRLCLVCNTSLGSHPFPICSECFDGLKPCTRCSVKKGYFDPRTKQQHSMCVACFQDHIAAPKKAKATLNQAPAFKPSVTVEHLWARLARASEVLASPIVQTSPFVDELTTYLEQAGNACDHQVLKECDWWLKEFARLRRGCDTYARIQSFDLDISRKRLDEIDTNWVLIERVVLALNCFDSGDFYGAETYLDEILGILEYEGAEAQRLPNLDLKIEELMEKWARAVANREARLAYMSQQVQTAAPAPTPAPQAPVQNRPAFVLDRICENCSEPSKYRFCIDCHKRLPDCPSCNERKVHVDKNGNPMPNCLDCFLATRQEVPEQKDTSPARTPQPTSAYRDADWRAKKLKTSQSGPPKGPTGEVKGKGKKN